MACEASAAGAKIRCNLPGHCDVKDLTEGLFPDEIAPRGARDGTGFEIVGVLLGDI